VRDKWDAIAPYRYHVAIENGTWPHYWTEKLADSFLGGALPIYSGCPNVQEYFDDRSLVRIDVTQPTRAIQTIERVIREDRYEQSREYVWQSRARVLDEHNFFPTVAALCRSLEAGPARPIVLTSEGFSFSARERLRGSALRVVRNSLRLGFRMQQRMKGSPISRTPPPQPP
jgi:hypothetical protein